MKNVQMTVGDILTIKADLSKEFGPSSSGKTISVASTEGNVSVSDGGEKVGRNVYQKE
jgi:hypothetical protein